MFCFFLAEKLGKSVEEIMRFTVTEIRYWSAYYEIVRRENERHNNSGGGSRPSIPPIK